MSDAEPAADDLPVQGHDPYAALRVPDFRWFVIGNFISLVGMQMQFAAVLWEIGHRTGKPLALGMVGLVQVIPIVSLANCARQVMPLARADSPVGSGSTTPLM